MGNLKPVEDMEYHPDSEKIVDILCRKTQNTNPLFFRVLTAHSLTLPASTMRCTINTRDRGKIPVNMYAINLANSGYGKGFATNVIEDHLLHKFKHVFTEESFPVIAEVNLNRIAHKRAIKDPSTSEEDQLEKVKKEFEQLGSLVFSFDSATSPAVKQMRHKLIMADAGSVNFTMDEIGSNLLGNVDVMSTFLELYDLGKVKQKLTKNTSENTRNEEIDGRTPTNMMLFGTPAKLLNGGKVEDEFYSMLDTGYARRCLFGYAKEVREEHHKSPKEIFDMLTDQESEDFLHDYSDKLAGLADRVNFNIELGMSEEVSLLLIEYRMKCEDIARTLGEHEELRKAEISHRYFKALKLAGTYAFVDQSPEVTEQHLYYAIKLVEESGEAFFKILNRDKNYVKLARYIAGHKNEITLVDLHEDLPFFRCGSTQKQEMMTLATAWGYKNNIIIRRNFNDGIEFLKGETLDETNLQEMIFSYSTKLAEDYRNKKQPWDKLHKLIQKDGLHWVNHHLDEGYRKEDNCIPGFNMAVIDVDHGIDVATAQLLLRDYTYLMYTTKSHTEAKNRFRIVFPLSHELKMGAEEYKKFIRNIYEWLPFEVDEQTDQRSRKWLSCQGEHWYNEGRLLDALMFIPKTAKNAERKKRVEEYDNLDNLERWMVYNTGTGNRNKMYLRYALVLVDAGKSIDEITNAVFSLNNKLPDPLTETEILATVIQTASKRIIERGQI